MSKDIEDVVKQFETKFFVKDGSIPVETYVEVEHFIRTTLKSQADQYEKEKGEMVREILATAYFDDWECHVIDYVKVEVIAQKYSVDLSE